MEKEILALEKNLFKRQYMNDLQWLNAVIRDDFVECGKSGCLFDKAITIEMLYSCRNDRKIKIFNYQYKKIDINTYLIHYITKSDKDLIYRTSIWVMEDRLKLLFHQASKLNTVVTLTES